MTTWRRPDLPSKCTFSLNKSISESPHTHTNCAYRPKIASDATLLIGNTPMVRLDRIAKDEGIECELLGKCEFLNIGGSVKDRIAKRMIEQAENEGTLKSGDTIIEPTSGNTGIGLALVASVKGYRCIIVMPEKMSKEKEYMLKGLGAEVIRTPTSANFDEPNSHLLVAENLKNQIGSTAHILNQYINPYNPLAHFDQTGEEIIEDCTEPDGSIKLNMVVLGAGTGGTVTGIARKIKSKQPKCSIIAVDPVGSILADPSDKTISTYDVEGIGYDFVPTVLDRGEVDKWYKTRDHESFIMARRLLRQEGLPCGGSSGSAVVAAIKAIKDYKLGKNDRVVIILPDAIRNYMTKFLSDNWMYSRGYLDFPQGSNYRNQWIDKPVTEFLHSIPKTMFIYDNYTIKEAINEMKPKHIHNAIVVNKTNPKTLLGVWDSNVLQLLLNGSVLPTDLVSKAMNKNFRQVQYEQGLDRIARELTVESYIVFWMCKDPYLVTREDFLQWSMNDSSEL